jgi:hypothetical protein
MERREVEKEWWYKGGSNGRKKIVREWEGDIKGRREISFPPMVVQFFLGWSRFSIFSSHIRGKWSRGFPTWS